MLPVKLLYKKIIYYIESGTSTEKALKKDISKCLGIFVIKIGC
ncbi:hypothetical protein C4K32_0701 [Pseudomonas chlororaphis subsp. piscium]|nr:hypothetical protein C4K32_0701 [Pseudomonas chlororaphis subsp. piscium]